MNSSQLSHLNSLLLITGLSGAGRSSTLETLADLGYYRIDNLPIPLFRSFLEHSKASPSRFAQTAIILAVEEKSEVDSLLSLLDEYKEKANLKLIFVDASQETIVRRYHETRRPHPGFDPKRDKSLDDTIKREQDLYHPLKERADIRIDTSTLTSPQLRGAIEALVKDISKPATVRINFISFGFKNGVPRDCDLIADARFLKNPHYVDELRPLDGRDSRVSSYVKSVDGAQDFIEQYKKVLTTVVPGFAREGKPFINVGIGCTGGQHRSVALAEAFYGWATKEFPQASVTVKHREIK